MIEDKLRSLFDDSSDGQVLPSNRIEAVDSHINYIKDFMVCAHHENNNVLCTQIVENQGNNFHISTTWIKNKMLLG